MDLRVPLAPILAVLGVPATVTLPNEDPVETTGVWQATPLEEDRPVGPDYQRREQRRVLALPRDVLPSIPRGTIIEAPEVLNGPSRTWRSDGLARADLEFWHIVVVMLTN